MIVDLIVEIFKRTGRPWLIGGRYLEVTEEHVRETLDMAAKELYTRPVGQQLEVGGLIIERLSDGTHDVWVHVGSYR